MSEPQQPGAVDLTGHGVMSTNLRRLNQDLIWGGRFASALGGPQVFTDFCML